MTPLLWWLVLAWLVYFLVHSLLASLPVKCWVAKNWPGLMPGYRLGFNGLAVLLLTVPLYLTYIYDGVVIFAWKGAWAWLANALSVAAVLAFLYSMRHYDGAEFLGIRQLREREQRVEDQEHFCISPLHRYVRHPWYFLALVLIWSRDMNLAMLISAVMMSLYFILGSKLEEKKLLAYYGDAYAAYRRQVPAIAPLPGKTLSREQAEELESMGNERDD